MVEVVGSIPRAGHTKDYRNGTIASLLGQDSGLDFFPVIAERDNAARSRSNAKDKCHLLHDQSVGLQL